jgi:hypothetical protein
VPGCAFTLDNLKRRISMTTAVQTPIQSEDRNLSLDRPIECPLPLRIFDDVALNELATSISTQGLISRLLVRPKAPQQLRFPSSVLEII